MQRLPGAGLHHGQHSHGSFIDARDDRHIPTQWPESVLGDDPARHSRHDAGASAAGFRPYNSGNGRDLFHANRPDRAWNSDGASYFHVYRWRHRWGDAIGFPAADDTSGAGYLFHVHDDRAAPAVRNTSYIVYDRFSRLDGTGVVIRDISVSARRYRNVHTDAIDGTESVLQLNGGQYSHDHAIDHDDVVDRDDASEPVGDYPHVDHRQHDRDHIAGDPARQLVNHRMQHYTGRSADQWRGFAALDPRSPEQPAAWHDSTRGRRACRHQH
jgi:hypothetical protein